MTGYVLSEAAKNQQHDVWIWVDLMLVIPPEKQVGLNVEFSRMIYQGDFT